jgi:acetyl-CoA carboxylase carboxyl transferase subunit alpha
LSASAACSRCSAERHRIAARHLLEHGIVDEVVPEPAGGAHADWDATARALRETLLRHLAELRGFGTVEMIERRQAKFEGMGAWREAADQRVRGEVAAGD